VERGVVRLEGGAVMYLANADHVIVRPVTPDGMAGYDEFNQFWATRDGTTFSAVADLRATNCELCGRAWENTGPALLDQLRLYVFGCYVHETCLVRHRAFNQHDAVLTAFEEARINHNGLIKIPNQYYREPDPWALAPWYSADLFGIPNRLVIGRRKRVWSIEVSLIQPTDAKLWWWSQATQAFEQEEVTKDFTEERGRIHAWSDKKMIEYVSLLARIAGYDSLR